VAVGHVVHELAHRPAAVTVRGVELDCTEALDGGAEIFRKRGEDREGGVVVGEIGFGAAEFSDGEAGIDDGGCGSGAHIQQGTPRVRGGTRRTGSPQRIQRTAWRKWKRPEGPGSGGLVVRRAVVDPMMMVVMVMRRRKSRSCEREDAAEEKELLHGYQNGMNKCGLSLEI